MKNIFRVVTALITTLKIFQYRYHRILKRFPPELAMVEKKINGAGFRLDLREEVDFSLYIDPSCNRKELEFFFQHLSSGGTFLDIGANIGFFSIMLARAYPSAQIIAFEPDPVSLARFELSIRTNTLSNIRIGKYAISSHSGTVSFRVNETGNRGGSGIAADPDPELTGLIRVPCRKLLDALKDLNILSVDCMKIDIEGHEYETLKMFLSEAPRSLWPTAIVAEEFGHSIRAGGESVIQLLIGNGYDLADHTDYNFFFILRQP